MKIGTLVRLHKDTGWDVKGHGIGVVISSGRSSAGEYNMRLVSFPKLGVEEWREARLLEVIA